jgi:hypothetical protein
MALDVVPAATMLPFPFQHVASACGRAERACVAAGAVDTAKRYRERARVEPAVLEPMIPSQRAEFSAIVDRPPLKLPGNARLIFWTIVNYEVWDIGRPMARQVLPAPTGQVLLPDVPHWSWHEYGMRVGCWRFYELFERIGI